MKFLTKSVPMWRAILAVVVSSVVATTNMFVVAKEALDMQKAQLSCLSSLENEDED